MKIKIYSFTIALLTISSLSFSQEVTKDSVVTENSDKYKVVTNKFFDNWFLGAGGGVQILFGDHDKQMQTKDRLTPAFNVSLGKWFTPGVGIRAGYTGNKLKGLTHNNSAISGGSLKTHSTGEIYQDVKNAGDKGYLEVQEFNYNHIHGDILFNVANIFGGYRENRFYTIAPFVGIGWAWVNDAPKTRQPSINVGLYNAFRLSSAFNLTLDLRGSLVKDDFEGEVGGRKEEGIVAGTLGLAYNFKKRNWDREKVVTISTYDETELNALRERVNKLANDNDALRKQLAESANKDITDVKIEKNILISPILVTFPINESTVSNEARVNLGFFAKAIKEGKSNVVYNISGYADKGTGSPATNERLSKARAEAIYNVLVKEFGVPASQLTTSHYGGVDNMYYNDPRLSRAVIVLGN
ncbi:MAG: OmpA family protein [Sphingobacterium composti]|uniref:OmpA family protein n=1 Tax=Sphingobacterium composti TaxID=363260 RepID=UPI00135CAB80|nr:OmpA family protein [Sphingobacterium composti Ten et al. 2007 non Yoo et al. 2007]